MKHNMRKTGFLVLLLLCLSSLPRVWADDTSEIANLLVPLMFLLIAVGIIVCMIVTVLLLVILVTKT